MFREAIGYPTRRPTGGRSVILGGLLLVVIAFFVLVAGFEAPYRYLAPLGLLPWLLVRGYYVRVIRTTIGRERPTPPRFGDVRKLLGDGLAAVAISVAYLLPGAVVLAPLAGVQLLGSDLSTALSAFVGSETLATTATSVVGMLAVGAVMYTLGALYVLPIAVARFAHTDRLRSAFELRTIVSGAVTEDYAIAWGISVVLRVVLLPVAYLLRILLFGFFLQFIVAMGVRYCYGQGAGAALDLTPVATVHDRSDPAVWELSPAVRRITDGSRWQDARGRADRSSGAATGDGVDQYRSEDRHQNENQRRADAGTRGEARSDDGGRSGDEPRTDDDILSDENEKSDDDAGESDERAQGDDGTDSDDGSQGDGGDQTEGGFQFGHSDR